MSEANGSETAANDAQNGGRAMVVLLFIAAAIGVLLFGAVDTGTLVILAAMMTVVVVIWALRSIRLGFVEISFDTIQLTLIALFAIGLVQLLPLGNAGAPAALMTNASNALSLDPYATRIFLARLFLCIVFFAAALTFINDASRIRTVVVLLIAFTGLLGFYSILQRVEDPNSIYGLRQSGQALPFGTYVNRHHFAALMEMALGLSLGVLFMGGLKRNKWPFIIAGSIVMTIAIVLTGSRGGMIGVFSLVVAIAVCAAVVKRRHGSESGAMLSPIAVGIGGLAILIATVALVVFLGGTDPLLRSSGLTGGTGDLTSGRLAFWKAAVNIFLGHPLAGVGLDAFGDAYSSYDLSSGKFRVEQAHNDYLQILADAGILGFACVASFIYLFVKKSLRTVRESHSGFRRGAAIGAFAGCVAVMVHSFVDFPLRTPANAFVFLLLAAIAVVPIHEEHKPRHRRLTKSSI
jgi:O-antigen ligase